MIASSSVPLLLAGLVADDPGRPRLTWYGPDGERVEFSAKVLGNWVAKTSNLLVNELDAGPGTRVHLALPPHWRTVVWLLSAWSVGAHVVAQRVVPTDPAHLTPVGRDDVVVACDAAVLAPGETGGAHRVAVALPALATAFGPTLPAGALDSGVEVRLQGDAFVPLDPPSPQDPALTVLGPASAGGSVTSHGELLNAARTAARTAELPAGVRMLSGAGGADAIRGLLAPLVSAGSLVLHHDPASAAEADLTRLCEQEGVTARF